MKKICEDCKKCLETVGWIVLSGNIFLAVLQGSVGFATGSKACIAIALQSICDVIGSCTIIWTQKVSAKPANEEFPYGYGKVEFIATAFASLFFIAAATVLTVYDIEDIMGTPTAHSDVTPVLVAIVSAIVSEKMFRYMQCVGRQSNSQIILANASSSKAGVYAALVVGLSAFGPWVGLPVLDDIGSLLVVGLIAEMLFRDFVKSLRGLLDYSSNERYEERIESVALGVAGVTNVGRVKTKQMGRKIWAELEIFVDPACSVAQGRRIADAVKEELLAAMDGFENVLVNFRPAKRHAECEVQA